MITLRRGLAIEHDAVLEGQQGASVVTKTTNMRPPTKRVYIVMLAQTTPSGTLVIYTFTKSNISQH